MTSSMTDHMIFQFYFSFSAATTSFPCPIHVVLFRSSHAIRMHIPPHLILLLFSVLFFNTSAQQCRLVPPKHLSSGDLSNHTSHSAQPSATLPSTPPASTSTPLPPFDYATQHVRGVNLWVISDLYLIMSFTRACPLCRGGWFVLEVHTLHFFQLPEWNNFIFGSLGSRLASSRTLVMTP